jgi:hypothetical protein
MGFPMAISTAFCSSWGTANKRHALALLKRFLSEKWMRDKDISCFEVRTYIH